jgi:hypothetical protein
MELQYRIIDLIISSTFIISSLVVLSGKIKIPFINMTRIITGLLALLGWIGYFIYFGICVPFDLQSDMYHVMRPRFVILLSGLTFLGVFVRYLGMRRAKHNNSLKPGSSR